MALLIDTSVLIDAERRGLPIDRRILAVLEPLPITLAEFERVPGITVVAA